MRRGPEQGGGDHEVVGRGDLGVPGLPRDHHDGAACRLDERGVVGGLRPGAWTARSRPAANAWGSEPRPARRGRPPRRRGRRMVSVTGRPGRAASAPAARRRSPRAKRRGDARGRAASWTTITSAPSGTAASPARTEAERVAPPATVWSATASTGAASATTATTPSVAAAAVASDQSITRRSPRRSYCLRPARTAGRRRRPRRSPRRCPRRSDGTRRTCSVTYVTTPAAHGSPRPPRRSPALRRLPR